MTEPSPSRHYVEGDAAYERGEVVSALRWWLLGVDEDDTDSLNAALEVSQSEGAEQDDPWNQLLGAIKHVHEAPARLALQARMYEETAEAVNLLLNTDPVAPWSQFSLSPTEDLTLLTLPVIAEAEPMTNDDDDDWMRVRDVLEESDVIFFPLGCNVVAGTWAGDFDWSVPVLFGIDPPETPQRKLRISSPLLIGLPAPGMAPDLEPEAPLPQAGFDLPLRPMQILFARGCLALAEIGVVSWMPMLRFGADLPDQDRPIPRIAAGFTDWIMGPGNVHRLRYSLPQVSVGYEVDLSLSGPHLKSAVAGAVDSVVVAVARTAEACKRNPSVFCEYITSIANPLAAEQWDQLYADMVYPAEFAEVSIWADTGLPSAMVDLGTALSRTPGLELDAYQWFDRAIERGYSPALASATWTLLCAGSFDNAVAVWEHGREACRTAARAASGEEREALEQGLRNAESNAAIAEYIRSDASAHIHTWRTLAQQGHLESLINAQVADLLPKSNVTAADVMQAAQSIAQQRPSDAGMGNTYLSFAEGLLQATGPFSDWCRLALDICAALGGKMQVTDDRSAHRARDTARQLRDAGEGALALPLQEAATRYGLPYAGADHSWGLLSAGRFADAIALYDEAAPAIERMLAQVVMDNPDLGQTWQREWANYRSNIALCRIALGEDPAWSLDVWNSGASTGNVESIFHPAVVALRAGDTERARGIVASMEGSKVAEMTSIALEGSRSSSPFWREWSLDGLRLLQAGDSPEATPSLSSLKASSTGLGGAKLSDPDPLASATSGPLGGSDAYRFCPNCGTARVPDGRFCVSCGFAYG